MKSILLSILSLMLISTFSLQAQEGDQLDRWLKDKRNSNSNITATESNPDSDHEREGDTTSRNLPQKNTYTQVPDTKDNDPYFKEHACDHKTQKCENKVSYADPKILSLKKDIAGSNEIEMILTSDSTNRTYSLCCYSTKTDDKERFEINLPGKKLFCAVEAIDQENSQIEEDFGNYRTISF